MEHVRRTQEKTSKCVQWPKLEQCEQQNNVELDYKVWTFIGSYKYKQMTK